MRSAFLKIVWIWILLSGIAIGTHAQDSDNYSLHNNGTTVFDTHHPKLTNGIKERSIDEGVLRKIRRDEAFWYANMKPERTKATAKYTFWLWLIQQGWFRSLIWFVIAGGFAGVLIWYLSSLNVHLFRRAPRNMEALTADDITEDLLSMDLNSLLQKAVQEQDYRMAIRIHFLQLLKELSQKNIIQYQTGLTNADYIQQLRSTGYYNDFFSLTRQFEYTWYGQMKISEEAFSAVQQKFEIFKQQFPS